MANPARPVTGTVIDTAWGLNVADSVVRVYANAAARDADLAGVSAAELLGQAVVLTDTGALLVYAGAAMGWRRPWSLPWGVMGYGESNKQAGGDGTNVAVTTVVYSTSWPAGRVIRATSLIYCAAASGTMQGGFWHQGQSAQKRVTHTLRTVLTGEESTTAFASPITQTAFTSSLQMVSGGLVDNFPSDPHTLIVEDIGPAANPTALVANPTDDDPAGLRVDVASLEPEYRAVWDALAAPDLEPLEYQTDPAPLPEGWSTL